MASRRLLLILRFVATLSLSAAKTNAPLTLNYLYYTGQIKTICYGGSMNSVDDDDNALCNSASAVAKVSTNPSSTSSGFKTVVSSLKSMTKDAFNDDDAKKNDVIGSVKSAKADGKYSGAFNYFAVGDFDANSVSGTCASIGTEFYYYDSPSMTLTKVDGTSLPSGISTGSMLIPVYSGSYDSSTSVVVNLINTSPWDPVTLWGTACSTYFFSTFTMTANQMQPLATPGQSVTIPALTAYFSQITTKKDKLSAVVVYTPSTTMTDKYDVYYAMYSYKSGITNCNSDPCLVLQIYNIRVPVASASGSMSYLTANKKKTRRLLQSGSSNSTDSGIGGCRNYAWIGGKFICF